MYRLTGLIFMLWFLLAPAAGEEVYRTQDAEGAITITDTPAADDASVEQVELPPGPPEASRQQSRQRQQEIREAARKAERRRLEQQQRQQARIGQAEAGLAEAEAKLAETKLIKDEDRRSLVSGKRGIRPEYFERVEAAEAEVEAARKRLKEVRGY